MSFLEKIRKKTWLILLFTGISLISFILDPNILLNFFSKNPNVIGKVNGENIYLKEYVDCFQFLKRFRQGETDLNIKNEAWKLLIHEKSLNQQAIKLGIESTDQEFWKAVEKQSIYNQLIDFQDDKGNIDMNKFKLYVENIEKNSKISNPQLEDEKNIWLYEKKSIPKRIIAKKYVEMLMYGLNPTDVEVELNHRNKKTFSVIDYVFLPYSEIDRKYNIYPIKKSEVSDFFKNQKQVYRKEDLRYLSFVIFKSVPSFNDKKNMEYNIKKLFDKLKSSNKNYDIVSNESEKPFDSNFYIKKHLPIFLQSFVEKKPKVGAMFGPVNEDNIYIIAKLTGKKMIYDSVLSSHILISHKNAIRSSNKRTKKEAEKIAKSLYNEIKNNPYKFNSLIFKKSDDFINVKKNKGSLGWMKYENQNPIQTFDIFSSKNKKGTIGFTETKFGFHIIRIDDQKNPEFAYQFGLIIKNLTPSKETGNLIHKNVMHFMKENKYSNLNLFINNARKKKYETIFLEEVKKNQWNIHSIDTELDKEIINWSFNRKRKKGDKRIFITQNKDYIIAYLSDIIKKGISIKKMESHFFPFIFDEKMKKFMFEMMKPMNKEINLENIASHFLKKVRKSCKVNFYDSMIDHYKEPKVVGSIFSSSLNKTSKPLFGENGIFFVKLIKYNDFDKKPSYSYSEIEFLNNELIKYFLEKLGDILVEKSKIKDFRKNM
ncbi:SurA N-terminal domain-containing protein [Blattabacterium cuenoti]|uniref:SurA N-terminal domain-containing protein n=1 Tax=Blattabacterium cuenoti TaxID=1653831 RepID=UPI00163C5748|nr:SurA N-terminal domain-containing protein [Blattabacterium cuenoti]